MVQHFNKIDALDEVDNDKEMVCKKLNLNQK